MIDIGLEEGLPFPFLLDPVFFGLSLELLKICLMLR